MVDLVVGDDHEIFVDALSAALPRWDFNVIGTADTIESTLASIRRHQPDVCLLDRYFADGDALHAISDAASICERTKIVMLSADGDAQGMRQALVRGAVGYVNKTCGLSVLAAAIQGAVEGEVVVELAAKRTPQLDGSTEALRLVSQLTGRERDCLALLVEGVPTEGMAKTLGVSQTTVRTHVQSVLIKLGVHSRLEAAAFVLRYSLVESVRRRPTGTVSGR